ncbi:predicted protein [Arabidopsis lyrata subsp. lyrata]|uniref:Predicted protein n=1 Tax=Arabidopsis lyrata subsp. lyrata TaxID=81972 RepID=D7KD48_ARALL|nr:predicted protein [Arabidopsis lyrata subsp. lyrata]
MEYGPVRLRSATAISDSDQRPATAYIVRLSVAGFSDRNQRLLLTAVVVLFV